LVESPSCTDVAFGVELVCATYALKDIGVAEHLEDSVRA
jgi:hypothetical protein